MKIGIEKKVGASDTLEQLVSFPFVYNRLRSWYMLVFFISRVVFEYLKTKYFFVVQSPRAIVGTKNVLQWFVYTGLYTTYSCQSLPLNGLNVKE